MKPSDDIQVDDCLWPLVHVRFLGVPTTPQVEAYLARMTSLLERGEPYVSILDSLGMTGMGPPQQRQMQAAWKKQHAEKLKVLNQGTAFVITSPLVRLAVSTVFYLTPMHSPYLITGSLPQAVAWAVQRLEAAGLHEAAERVRHEFGLGASRHAGP